MRGFFLGLSLSVAFILGCVATQMNLVVPPAEAGVERQKWSYLCGEVGDAGKLQGWANMAGLEGWEMVGGSGMGHRQGLSRTKQHIWCFKRALP